MPIQKRLVEFGLGKQSAKGSALTDPTYEHGVSGGAVVQADVTEDDLSVTSDDRVLTDKVRTAVSMGAAIEGVVMPKSIGAYLLAATGAVTTTGAGPYTHTYTNASDVDYFTTFARYDTNYYKVSDAKLDELELSFDGTGALTYSASFLGIDVEFLAADFAGTTVETPADGILRPTGATFTVDGAAANITSGSISVSNALEPIMKVTDIKPTELFPGIQSVNFSLTVQPDNITNWRKMLTGADAGTSISESVYTGAVDLNFDNASDSLQFTASRCALAVSFPDADPQGGPAEVTIEGTVLKPTSGDTYQFVLVNDVATY